MVLLDNKDLEFKIVKTKEGLFFNTNDQDCSIHVEQSQGKLFAFIKCKNEIGEVKKYWGLYSHSNPKKYIQEIMKTGGKWNNLIN